MQTAIPTNLITGFLGVGKTTAIAHLLAHRPPGQRWAVLVNEFGQVGIDGTLLDDGEVAIRQVPGGCLCCVASQAFTVGLNRLIRDYRPDRLLIEPSGLGHPARVLDTLGGTFYQGVLDLRATLCLIDPRHLNSERHREHPNWQDQIALADVLAANKTDLCDNETLQEFDRFAAGQAPPKQQVLHLVQGRLAPTWLDLPRAGTEQTLTSPHHPIAVAPDCGLSASCPTDWQRNEGQGDGYVSLGWRFGPDQRFHAQALLDYLLDLDATRIKGIVPTDQGWQAINLSDGEGGLSPSKARAEAALEILHHHPLAVDELECRLKTLLLT